jgi:hypothetical protein
MSTARLSRRSIWSCLGVALLVTVAAATVLGLEVRQISAQGPPDQGPRVSNVFVPTHGSAEVLVGQMDGQAFAQIAADPLMRHPVADYYGDRDAAAYRAARPLLGWAGWAAAAGGKGETIAWAMLAVTAVSIGALAFVVSLMVVAGGGPAAAGLLVLALPGVLADLRYPGLSEPLAFSLALGGLLCWRRDRRAVAVLLLCLAALARETTILFAAALALDLLWRRRPIREALPLALPVVTYGAWCLVVLARVGQLPSGSTQLGLPLVGLLHAVPRWGPAEWLSALALLVGAVVIARRGRADDRWLLGVHLGFASLMTPIVWTWWWAFSRLTLPVILLAGVLHLTTRAARPMVEVPHAAAAPVG